MKVFVLIQIWIFLIKRHTNIFSTSNENNKKYILKTKKSNENEMKILVVVERFRQSSPGVAFHAFGQYSQ